MEWIRENKDADPQIGGWYETIQHIISKNRAVQKVKDRVPGGDLVFDD
jgi:hypothetical protein